MGNMHSARVKKLTSVVLPDGLRVIGDHAFFGCESIKRLVISKSVESIGEKAFWGVEEVTKVVDE